MRHWAGWLLISQPVVGLFARAFFTCNAEHDAGIQQFCPPWNYAPSDVLTWKCAIHSLAAHYLQGVFYNLHFWLDVVSNQLFRLAISAGWLLPLTFELWTTRFKGTYRCKQQLAISAGWLLPLTFCALISIYFPGWHYRCQLAILAVSAGWLLPLAFSDWFTVFTAKYKWCASLILAFSAGWLLTTFLFTNLATWPHRCAINFLANFAGWLLAQRLFGQAVRVAWVLETIRQYRWASFSLGTSISTLISLAFSAGWLLPLTFHTTGCSFNSAGQTDISFVTLRQQLCIAVWLLLLQLPSTDFYRCVRSLLFLTITQFWHFRGTLALILNHLAYIAGHLWIPEYILLQPCYSFLGTAYSFWHRIDFAQTQRGPLSSRDTIPGPNSGHSRKLKFLLLLWAGLLFQMPLFQTSWSGGEGCDFATEVTGAPMTWDEALVHQFGAKQRGTQPTMSSGYIWPTKDSVQKRSIRRAYKRALRDGTSWYRGRCYAVQDFTTMIPSLAKGLPQINAVGTRPPKCTLDLQMCNHKHQNKRYVRYLCWNGSGLSNHKLDELKVWCSEQGIDILILTETRWRYSNEWMDPHWMYLHTGCSSQPGAGIMLLISNSVCTHHDLRWHEVVPGRLVHVQIRLRQRCLDIIACYQHTYSGTKVKQAARQEWWSCLDRYLGTLPKRHVLLMAGDFNCRLPTLKGLVGCDDFRWGHSLQKGSPHPDEGLFTALVKAHQLVALNSWNPSLGPTFSGVNGRSRIDFAFTRLPLADGHAKDIKYLNQASFLNIPHVGHFPILGQIRKMWIPPVADQRTAGISMQQRDLGRMAMMSSSPDWMAFLESASPIVHHLEQACPDDPNVIPEMHRLASQLFRQCFPEQSRQMQASTQDAARDYILNKWRHRDLYRRVQLPTIRNVFHSWFHMARFQFLSRSHKKHAFLIRKQRFETIMEQAQLAAQQHNSYQLFQVINRFAAKMPKRRLQIRNRHGNMATPVEEMAILHAFVAKTWEGPTTVPKALDVPAGLPFTMEELLRALMEIPISRAVARPFSPGMIWRSLAPVIAPPLFRFLQAIWNCPEPPIPDTWRDAWLLLIPKPNKQPCSPDALRPLALQEPVGKSIIGLLAQVAQRESLPVLTSWPLWAYLPQKNATCTV